MERRIAIQPEDQPNGPFSELPITIRLSGRDIGVFHNKMGDPPPPSDGLRAAIADYFAFLGEEAAEELRRDLLRRRQERMTEQQGERNAVVEQLMAVVEARHGERMEESDREIVRAGIERNLA